MFSNLISTMPQVQAGRFRALGVTGLARIPAAPNVPTIAESGLPGYEVVGWYGMMAPAKTPASIVNLLQKEVAKILQMPEIIQAMQASGLATEGTTPEQYAEQIKRDLSRWQTAVKQAGIPKQ